MFDGTLVKRIFRVEIAERNADRGKRAVEAHSVRGLGADTEALLIGRRGLANDGAFAVDQPGGRNARVEIGRRILDVALGCLDGRVGAVEAAGFGHAFRPRGLIDVQLPRLCEGNDGFLLAEVVSLWRRLHLLQLGLLLRVGGKGGFIGLVGCRPQGGAKSDWVVVDGGQFQGTIAAIERELVVEGLVLRYSTATNVDALPVGEGTFLACSFWLADGYLLTGRRREAEALFERLLALSNDVGLFSEEYDPRAKRMLGNFPQALTHMALVNTARLLSMPEHEAKSAAARGERPGAAGRSAAGSGA